MIRLYLLQEKVVAHPSKLISNFEILMVEKTDDQGNENWQNIYGEIEFFVKKKSACSYKLVLANYGEFNSDPNTTNIKVDNTFLSYPGKVEEVKDIESGDIIAHLICSPRKYSSTLLKIINLIAGSMIYPLSVSKNGKITTHECFAYAETMNTDFMIRLIKCFLECHYSDARNSYI